MPRGSGNPRSADVGPVRKNPKGVSNMNVGRNEIPENVGHYGYEKHLVHGQGVEGSMPSGLPKPSESVLEC